MILLKNLLDEVISENSLDFKEIPEETMEKVMKMLDDHNKSITPDTKLPREYWIDVTGKHQAYYTFWLYRHNFEVSPLSSMKNPMYMGNLSTDLLSSVVKALSKRGVSNTKVILANDETRKNLIGKSNTDNPVFTFGKYRGMKMGEVFLDDPSYFSFLAKNMDPKYANSPSNIAIKFFADKGMEDATKKNQESSTSQFVGEVGGKFKGELTVYKMDFHPAKDIDSEPYSVDKMVDENGNKFVTYNLAEKIPNVKVNDKIDITAKIKAHKELVGIKFTVINYIKPVK